MKIKQRDDIKEYSEISDADVIRLDWLDAEEELCQVVEHPAREWIVVLTPSILQIIVAFVVKHLVRSEIHGSI